MRPFLLLSVASVVALGGSSPASGAPVGPGGSRTDFLTDDFIASSWITLRNDGRVLISETGAVGFDGSQTLDGAVLLVLPDGSTTPIVTGMLNPMGVDQDPGGVLYISDPGARTVTNDGDGVVWRAAGDGSPAVLHAGNLNGGGPFTSPSALLIDPADPDQLLVAEISGTLPFLPPSDGGILSVGRVDGALGTYYDDGVGGLQNTIDLAAHPDGVLLTADNGYGEITRVTSFSTFTDVSAGLVGSLRVAVSPGGAVYARDTGNAALLRLGEGGAPEAFLTLSDPDSVIADAVVEHETSIVVLVLGPEKGVYRVRTCIADFAQPFGGLDLADINAFVAGFVAMDPIADLNPDGLFDLADINRFVASFVGGCG